MEQDAASQLCVYIGGVPPGSDGAIHAWWLDASGMTPRGVVAQTAAPSFLAVHPSRRFIYAANEVMAGSLTGFRIEPDTARLTAINSAATRGPAPCHVAIDPGGRNALVANFAGGSVAVLRIDDGGALTELTSRVKHRGSSVDPVLQRSAHPHCVVLSDDGTRVFVADLGMDAVLTYSFDAIAGTLIPSGRVDATPGAGPRHLALHPDGKTLLQINELNSTIVAFDASGEVLAHTHTASTLPADFRGTNRGAHIAVHPTGKWIYVSNRGDDSIAQFSIDAVGRVALVDHIDTQGRCPRHFALDAEGDWLLVANQLSHTVVVFRVNKSTGSLVATGDVLDVPSPHCVCVVRV